MTTTIGIWKGLQPGEELQFENRLVTTVLFLKEAETITPFGRGRREMPISGAFTNVYVTNERIIFLVLYQVEATALVGRNRAQLSGVTGTWFELPRSAIIGSEMRPVRLFRGKAVKRFLERWVGKDSDLLGRPGVEIIYGKQDPTPRIRDYAMSLFRMNWLVRRFTKIERTYDKLLLVGEDAVSMLPQLQREQPRQGALPAGTESASDRHG